MSTRRRDIRTERQARDLAKRFGWGTPVPGDEPDDQVDDEPAQNHRTPIGPMDCVQPGESAHG